MLALRLYIKSLMNDESGQSMVEYGLMLALVALAIAAATPNVGSAVSTVFSKVTSSLGAGS
jgi:pilus assembly protein Flp/PilA